MAKKITLKHPVKVGELTVTEVTIQRPKTKDFIAVGSHQVDTAMADAALFSSLSGLPESVVSQIDIDDWSIIRTDLALIWASYFTSKEYSEDPIKAESAETPQSEIPETSSP